MGITLQEKRCMKRQWNQEETFCTETKIQSARHRPLSFDQTFKINFAAVTEEVTAAVYSSVYTFFLYPKCLPIKYALCCNKPWGWEENQNPRKERLTAWNRQCCTKRKERERREKLEERERPSIEENRSCDRNEGREEKEGREEGKLHLSLSLFSLREFFDSWIVSHKEFLPLKKKLREDERLHQMQDCSWCNWKSNKIFGSFERRDRVKEKHTQRVTEGKERRIRRQNFVQEEEERGREEKGRKGSQRKLG